MAVNSPISTLTYIEKGVSEYVDNGMDTEEIVRLLERIESLAGYSKEKLVGLVVNSPISVSRLSCIKANIAEYVELGISDTDIVRLLKDKEIFIGRTYSMISVIEEVRFTSTLTLGADIAPDRREREEFTRKEEEAGLAACESEIEGF